MCSSTEKLLYVLAKEEPSFLSYPLMLAKKNDGGKIFSWTHLPRLAGVYILFSDCDFLYVGKTTNLLSRFSRYSNRQHGRSLDEILSRQKGGILFFDIASFGLPKDEKTLTTVEQIMYLRLMPIHNRQAPKKWTIYKVSSTLYDIFCEAKSNTIINDCECFAHLLTQPLFNYFPYVVHAV